MPAAVNGLKFCPRCQLTKPVDEFSPDANSYRRDRLQTYCKACKQAQSHEYGERRKRSDPEPPKDGRKFCSRCRLIKSVPEFNRNSRSKDGYQTECRDCKKQRLHERRQKLRESGLMPALNRQANVTRRGLSQSDYTSMLAAQGDVCAICQKPETAKYRSRRRHLVIDHDHATGTIRKLLCSRCNAGLGLFLDSPALLEKAAAYLRQHGRLS